MLFTSWEFLCVFLVIVLAVLSALRGLQAKLIWLTVCSYVFYGFAGPQYTLLLFIATFVDFNVGRQIASATSQSKRRLWLAISILVNLGMLCTFKYANFFWRNILDLLEASGGAWGVSLTAGLIRALQYESLEDAKMFLKFALPAGISFYTFQSLSYTIDVYRNHAKPEMRFWKFACFVSLFPQLIAGPIVRYVELAPQMEPGLMKHKTVIDWEAGVLQFSVGLCKKVLIADRIGNMIDPLLANYHELDMVSAWLVMMGYAYQIYFDFSGYSDMAIGLARLLGFQLPINFDSPYRAVNPSDFWGRWHITLSRWMRDYVYIQMGGSKEGRLATLRNLIVTMFLGGLWHGAAWTFVIWGLFHGFLLVVYHFAKPWWDRVPLALARVMMFAVIVVSWVPFRSETLTMTHNVLAAMLGFHGLVSGMAQAIPLRLYVVIAVAAAIAHKVVVNSNHIEYAKLGFVRTSMLAIATVCALVAMNYSSKFLYFNF